VHKNRFVIVAGGNVDGFGVIIDDAAFS